MPAKKSQPANTKAKATPPKKADSKAEMNAKANQRSADALATNFSSSRVTNSSVDRPSARAAISSSRSGFRVTVMVAVVILASRYEFAASVGLFTPCLFTVSKSLAR